MGEIAELMLNGDLCQWCGENLDGEGFPTVCGGCQIEHGVDAFGEPLEDVPDKNPVSSGGESNVWFDCDICRRMFKTEVSRDQHRRDKHG